MKAVVFLFSIIVITVLLSTCYYDSEEYLFPNLNKCDTTNVTYTLSVKPILENNCFSCHSNNNYPSGGGIKLENYGDLKIKADDGHLIGAITHATGFSKMPLGQPQLDACKITTIQKWVNEGAPNN